MLRERKDYPTAITPRGAAIWPALNEPDFKFKKEYGEYHARLRFEPDTPGLAEVVAAAQAILDEAYDAKVAELTKAKKGAILKELKKAEVLREEIDQETGDPTGFVIFRASMNAGGKIARGAKAGQEFFKRPDFFDAKGKQVKNPPKIGGGSEMKLSVRMMDYETDGGKTIGVRFELEGVQLLKIVSGGQRTADHYGFGEEEGDEIEEGSAPEGGFSDESGSGDHTDF